MHLRLVLLSFLLFAADAAASEGNPVDVRVSVIAMPKSDYVEVTYRVPSEGFGLSGETAELGAGWRLEAGLVTRLVEFNPRLSLVGGAWFFYGDQDNQEFAPGTRDIPGATGPMEMTTMGVDFYLALSLRMSSYLEMELGPFVGVGTARISDRGVSAEGPEFRVEKSGNGDYEEAGAALTIFAHNQERSFLFGLGVRYLVAFGQADFAFDVQDAQGNIEPNGLEEEVEVTLRGFAPYLTMALTF